MEQEATLQWSFLFFHTFEALRGINGVPHAPGLESLQQQSHPMYNRKSFGQHTHTSGVEFVCNWQASGIVHQTVQAALHMYDVYQVDTSGLSPTLCFTLPSSFSFA